MRTQTEKKPIITEELYQNRLRNVAGTMAIEGINLSEASRRNLDRYAHGQVNYQQIMSELMAKYQRER